MKNKKLYYISGMAISLVAGLIILYFVALSPNIGRSLEYAQNDLKSKNYESAINSYSSVLRKDPSNAEAIIGISKAYLEKGDVNKAIEKLKILEDINYPSSKLYLLRSEIYIAQQEVLKANTYLENSLNKVSDNSQKAEMYLKMGEICKGQVQTLAKKESKIKADVREINRFAQDARQNYKKFIELMPADSRTKDIEQTILTINNKIYFEIHTETSNYENDVISKNLLNPYLNVTNIETNLQKEELNLEFYFKPTVKMASAYVLFLKFYDDNGQIITHEKTKEISEYLKYDETQKGFMGSTKAKVALPLDKDILSRTLTIHIGVTPKEPKFIDPNINRAFLSSL